MLRRLQVLQKVRERVALLQLCIAGIHVQPNLQTHCSLSRALSCSSRKPWIPVRTSQGWLTSIEKHYSTTTRSDTGSQDDDLTPDQITENGYARTVIANSKKTPNTIGTPLKTIENVSDEEAEKILSHDWTSSSAEEILKAFKSLSCYASLYSLSLNEDRHGPILRALSTKLHNLNNEQLMQIFECLLLWSGGLWNKCPAYTNLSMEINNACVKRLPNWSVDELLMITDYWYQLRLPKKGKFTYLAMKTLGKKPRRLNPMNFLHYMFLINIDRKPVVNMYELEYRLDSILEEFTPDELGVICMGFFKSQSPFRDQRIVSRMLTKVMQNWDQVQDISLSAIMKMTRYSMGLKELLVLTKVLKLVKGRVSELSIPCLVHILHAAGFVQCYNPELIQMTIERFEKDIDKARLKDMERLCWVLTIFNYGPETPIYHKIVEELRHPSRKEEIERYPTVASTTLMHLSHVGVYPVDLIEKTLDPEFLRKVYNNNVYKIEWDIFALDNNVRIEFPAYKGPFLNDNIREFLAKRYMAAVVRSFDKAQSADKFALEVAHLCKSVLAVDSAVHIDQVLPHFLKADIIVCFDEANNPVAPGPLLSKIPIGSVKNAPQEPAGLRWIAIVLATQNQMLRNTDKYIGMLECKLRQLRIIGYTPLVVPVTEWHGLASLDAKQNYVRNLLSLRANRKASAGAF